MSFRALENQLTWWYEGTCVRLLMLMRAGFPPFRSYKLKWFSRFLFCHFSRFSRLSGNPGEVLWLENGSFTDGICHVFVNTFQTLCSFFLLLTISSTKMYHSQTWKGYTDKLHHTKVSFKNLILHVNQSSVCILTVTLLHVSQKQNVQIIIWLLHQ